MSEVHFSSRYSKIDTSLFAPPPVPIPGLLDIFPRTLAAENLRELAAAIVNAHRKGKPVIFCMGSHVIKTGLSPIMIDLMRRGIITCLATNGSAIVHDVELSLFGGTSEDVEASLAVGKFGTTLETQHFIHGAFEQYVPEGDGLGAAIGWAICGECDVFGDGQPINRSLFASAVQCRIPACVHVAIGTDVFCMHIRASGKLIGEGSLRDFRSFCAEVEKLGDGGVLLNIGSAVVLPEAALKAVASARAKNISLEGSIFANLDFLPGYRAQKQIVDRPRLVGAKTYDIRGCHELLVPLLASAVVAELDKGDT